MRKIIRIDQVHYEEVPWGITKTLVGPETVGSTKVKVKLTEYLPGYVHQLHAHPNQEEVIWILSGEGVTETEDDRNEIGPGSLVFIPAGMYHATRNSSLSEPLKAIIIKVPPGDEEVVLSRKSGQDG